MGYFFVGGETPENRVDVLLLDQQQVHLIVVVVAFGLQRKVVQYFQNVALRLAVDIVEQVDDKEVDQDPGEDLLVVFELHD